MKKKEPLEMGDYAKLSTILKDSIIPITYAPHPDSVAMLLFKLFTEYPHLVLIEGDIESSVVTHFLKIYNYDKLRF